MNNNHKIIKTMKSKSIIGAALAAIFTVGLTTSCEDMFNIESNRVVQQLVSCSVSARLQTATLSSVKYVVTW